MIDLAADCARASSNIRQAHIDRLLALDVPPEALADLGTRQLPFGADCIGVDDSGRWWPDPEGTSAIVLPVVEHGEVIDIVAFRSSQPARWWWRAGCASMLGQDLLDRSVWPGDKLLVVGTPLAWIAAAGQACCILDWGLPDYEIAPLRDRNELVCDTPLLAGRLRKRLAQPRRVPPISIQMGIANGVAA